MAPGYSPYSNYYDPVGSQANQPQGYAYHNPTSSASQSGTAAYHPPTYAGYPTGSYASQKYTSNAGAQHTGTVDSGTASNAATGANVAGLSGQDGQTRASRSSSTQQYESGSGSWGNPNFASASYTGTLQMPERSQSNTSPLYASNAPSGNFGRMRYDAPSQQPQSNTPAYSQESYIQQSAPQSYATNATADASRQTYGATQQKKTTTEPSRYASPLHAVQAQQQQNQSRQQGHARQSSGASNHQPSPMNNPRAPASYTQHRQSSASVEPTANTTVDPSQVYDFRAEREKKAKAEAEKRRKMEEVEAAKKAEEARLAEQQRQADEAKRQAEERIEKIAKQAKRKAEQQAKRKADEEAKAAAAAAAAEENRKSRENPNAASTLASLASSSNVPGPSDALAPDDEEAQMRAMFQKMREFNSKNPAMLAKLWEEERRSHAAQSQSPQPAKPALSSKNDKSGPITATPSERAQPIAGLSTSSATLTAPAVQNQVSVNPLQPANAHLWPPGKKVLLAEVAAKWLTSTNPPRVVTTSQVLERLDRNPNYVQLCESLEATGLRIDRAAFAREILKSVQQPGPAAQTSPKTSDSTLMSANGTIAQAASTATETASPQAGEPKAKKRRATKAEMEQRRALGLAKGKRPVNSSNMVDYEMPVYSTVADTPGAAQAPLASTQEYSGLTHTHPLGMSSHQHTSNNNSRQPSQSMVPEQQPIANAHQDSPIPVGSAQPTLEVKPHSPPRPPADKEEAARKRGFGDLVDLTAEDSDEDAPPKRIMLGPQDQSSQRQPMQQQQPGSFGKFSVRQYASPKPNFPSQPLVPPGAPTTAQPLMQNGNFSMAPTADKGFKFSNTPINPSAQPTLPTNAPPPPKRKGPTNEQLQADRIRGKMVVEPIMRDRVARRSAYDSRTIARDVLLATGRHPDMRPLNSHLNVMQKMLGDKGGMADTSGNKSDLATIRWDIIDPDPPRKSEKSKDAKDEELPTGVTRSTEVDGQDADDEKDMSSTQKRGVVTDVGSDRQSFPIRDNKPTPKKRGRPPRASNGDNFNMTTPAANPGATRHIPSQMRGTPSSSNAAEGAIGYAAFRQLDENGNPIKKKGRPVGWRKSVHSREAQGLTPAKPGTSSATKPKSKPTVAKQEARLQEPTYQVYKCSWLGCSAELHSLEILKKHIIKVHGQAGAEDLHSCLWQGCQTKSNGKQSATFDNIDDWLAHVDKEHLQPVAWQLGDGPRGGLSDQLDSETSEAYLSDSRGRSVTPIIRPMANFGLGEGPGQGSYSGLGRPPAGSSKDERVARAELQKLKDRKKAVGPSLEKTGVRLANDKRRMGFLDDENFEDVVESEGEGPAN